MRWGLAIVFLSSGFAQNYTVATLAGGAPRPAPRANGSIGSPAGVTVDPSGNVYFYSLNCVFKLDATGGLTRIAGDYVAGYSGDGGSATLAQLDSPVLSVGMAVDAAGNLYIPDSRAGRVRRVSLDGTISTFAGNGNVQTTNSGEGGPAINAFVGAPNHVAFDGAGNLYIGEGFGKVQRVSPAGIITTVAGGGFNGQTGDGGPAVGAYIQAAAGVAVDPAGNLYIAEPPQNRVRKVSTAGIITTFAGTGIAGYSGDGGPAANAQLSEPVDLALDSAGNLYISESGSNHIRKVTPAGIISTAAGNGNWGYAGDGMAATAAALAPLGMALDGGGNLYVSDAGANRIRKISAGGTVSTLAGDGTLEFSGDGGPALNAELSMPGAMTTDSAGNVYIADIGNNRVRKVSLDSTITTVAGNGSPGYSGDGGPATQAAVMPQSGLAFDAAGNLYIAEAGRVRKVTPAGVISTVPGTAGQGPASPPENTLFIAANRLAVDNQGNIYLAAIGIQEVSGAGVLTQFANTRTPAGIAADSSGNLYASDPTDVEIFEYPAGGGPVGAVILHPGDGCKPPQGLPFTPNGLAVDGEGNLYATDGGYSVIRRITPTGGIDVIAGNFTSGYSGDGGPAAAASFSRPVSVAVDGMGNIYVADATNNVVRVLRPAAAPSMTVSAVTNAASNIAGPVSAGEIVALYGVNLGPRLLVGCTYPSTGLTDTDLNDTQVLFNGVPAPVLYTSAGQVAAVAPANLTGATVQVSVSYLGHTSAAVSVAVALAAPALFTIGGTGTGQAAAVNQDGTINSATNPAHPGEFISLYATGVGTAGLPITVIIGGQSVAPQYAGPAPGYLAGLTQINALIPSGIRAGSAIPASIQAAGVTSPAGVTIAVTGN